MDIKKIIYTAGMIILTTLFNSCEKNKTTEPVTYDEIIWTKSDSPILIDSCFVVPENTVLKIESGVEIKFKASSRGSDSPDFDYGTLNVGMIKVNGRIEATGAENDSIVFTRQGMLGNWGVVFINKTSHGRNIFKYCKVEYANQINNFIHDSEGYSRGALSLFYSAADVENCHFTQNNSDAILCYSGQSNIRNCDLEGSLKNGILFVFSDGLIDNNNIMYNGEDYSHYAKYFGINCSESDPVISNNRFVNNFSFTVFPDHFVNRTGGGNGIICSFSNPEIKGNEFRNNEFGIVCSNSSNAVVKDNTFTSCFSGIHSDSNSDMKIENNIINSCYFGIELRTGSFLANNLIVGCESGVYFSNEETNTFPVLINNSVVNSNAYGMQIRNSGNYYTTPDISNSIIYGSGLKDIHIQTEVNENVKPKISYSLIGDDALDLQIQDMGNNIFNKDPLLDSDFKPLPNSPCIDAGNSKLKKLPKTDLGGGNRINGADVDIGAYEYGN